MNYGEQGSHAGMYPTQDTSTGLGDLHHQRKKHHMNGRENNYYLYFSWYRYLWVRPERQLLTLLGGLLLIFLAVSLVEVIEMPAINRLKLDKNCKSIMINLSYIISIIFRQLKGV